MRVRELLSAAAAALMLSACSFPLSLGNRSSQYQSNSPALPVFNPGTGSYQGDQNVAITSATVGAVIYYETGPTDAATPKPNKKTSPSYSTPIAVTGAGTTLFIKAMAVKAGMDDSAAVTSSYTINPNQVSTPQFDLAPGTQTSDVNVTVSCPDSSAVIYYETGSVLASVPDPTTSSPEYLGTIPVAGDGTDVFIKIRAFDGSLTPSTVESAHYTISYLPTTQPNIILMGTDISSNVFVSSVTIVMGADAGAQIYYTTNGTTPSTASPVYTAPIIVSAPFINTQMIRAMAVRTGYKQSAEASATYQLPLIATDLTPPSGFTNWFAVSSDATGSHRMVSNFGGTLLISANQGVTWTAPTTAGSNWQASAMSSNGDYMIAADRSGYIWYSSDTGVTWSQSASPGGLGWYGLASTTTGGFMLATASSGNSVYQSTDHGLSWTQITASGVMGGRAVAMSSNGDYILGANASSLAVSQNGGGTWFSPGMFGNWNSVAVSGSGQYMAAADFGGNIDVSNNYGNTGSWSTPVTGTTNWYGVAMSSDGSYMIAVGVGVLSVSRDFGATWTDQPLPPAIAGATLQAVASDQYGKILTVAVNGGSVWNILIP